MTEARASHNVTAARPLLLGVVGTIASLLRAAAVDRVVAFGVAGRLVQLIAGPVTILLVARHMSPDMQGYYYTFGSVLALQSFLELGFYLVIINFASHEWAYLRLDARGWIEGDERALSRLAGLGRLAGKWYAVASSIFIGGVGTAGYLFFSQAPAVGVDWEAPWFTLVVLTGLLLWTLPFDAMLEGCNQVMTLQRYRLGQALVGNLALWTTIALGGGLWAAVVWTGINLSRSLLLLLVRYRRFFASILHAPRHASISWRTEIWPMQWRLGLSGLVNYFAFSMFNPVMFRYHGAAVAGQMGMTWALVTGVQSVALMWIYPRVPQFGMLIAKRDFAGLDRYWRQVSLASVGVIALGAMAAWSLVYALHVSGHPLAVRVLLPLPTGLLFLAVVVAQIGQCHAVYLRAHKQEPLTVLSVTTSLLIGLLVWTLGSRFGPLGAAAAYLGVMGGLIVPWGTLIWLRSRAAWHQE